MRPLPQVRGQPHAFRILYETHPRRSASALFAVRLNTHTMHINRKGRTRPLSKEGFINDGTVEQANEALEAHELIKCSVLDTSSLSAREAANELAERCHAEVVQVIGRKFSIYRETSRDDVEKIKLV